MEEGILVDLLGPVGMADEDDLDVAIAPLQEHVEQHVEPLGEILHVLGHRAGHIHQAEHHGLGDRLGHGLEAAVADIDGIDERDAARLCLQRLDLCQQFGAARLVALGRLRLQLLDLFRPWPPQRHPPRQRAADRAADRDICGRA